MILSMRRAPGTIRNRFGGNGDGILSGRRYVSGLDFLNLLNEVKEECEKLNILSVLVSC